MLLGLTIRDIVLIEKLDLRLQAGLCVLTGETGAGKSILLDSLSLALGGRADANLVRHGAAQGAVAASFELEAQHPAFAILIEQGLEANPAEPLVLRRVLGQDGKSRAFINDQPTSIGLLKRLGSTLVELHGQGAEQTLLDSVVHRTLLDVYGQLDGKLQAVRIAYAALREAASKQAEVEARLQEARRDEDYLRFVLSELDRLDPKPNEETDLADERQRLMQGEKLAEAFRDATDHLAEAGGIDSRLRLARRAVERGAERLPERLKSLLEVFDRAENEVAELLSALDRVGRELNLDPGRLEKAEERLFALRAAARKHGCSVDQLAAKRADFVQRLSAIDTGDVDLKRLAVVNAKAKADYQAAARALSEARIKIATKFNKAVMDELGPLKLGNAKFQAEVEPQEAESGWSAEGIDRVTFLAATNPGAPLSPLAKIASGGELSRFMLALRVVLAAQGSAATLVFDEVDQGVGGATAAAVGERLAKLANAVQVLVVTHSPQVAAKGRHHWSIAKAASGNGKTKPIMTSVSVRELAAGDRQEEIARMLAGAVITDEARGAAKSLLEGRST